MAVLLLLPAAGCGEKPESAAEEAVRLSRRATLAELAMLTELMSGSFSSAEHAASDPGYHDVRLEMVPIWTSRDDGPWIYVEQAIASALEKPYRQRIYRLSHVGGDLFESRVLKLPAADEYVGAYAEPDRFDALQPEELTDLAGCAVLLRRIDEELYRGSTLGAACENSFGDAAYATSYVEVTPDGIVSWDRGYDAAGLQVWGAEKGGYRFLRLPRETAE